MAGGKRPLSVKAKASIESAIEDKETPFDNIEEMDQHSDDDDSSDSSVYSELDESEEGSSVEEESEEDEAASNGEGSDEEGNDDESVEEEEEKEALTDNTKKSSEKGDDNDKEKEDNDKEKEASDKETEKEIKTEKKSKKGKKLMERQAERMKKKIVIEKNENDEYVYDSSDEEDIRNTIGNIPVNWYDDYDHIGYDWDGKPIRKPKRGDELDKFLNRMDNPEHGITVTDPMTGQDVVLSEKDIEAIRRLRSSKVPDSEYNLYEDWIEWFSSEVMETPIRDLPETKRSFLPSLDEKRIVGKMVHAIKMGWMKPASEKKKDDPDDPDKKTFYMLWKTDDQPEEIRRIQDLIPAPKMRLPGHEESYNPPPEYLFTEKEKEVWAGQADERYKRKLPFVPQKYSSLRQVPAYKNFIAERFERCLDLYLAPRARKMRLTIQPEDLVPQLPKPQDLQPFPQVCALTFKGHKNMIRTLSVEPKGQFVASGSDDGTVRIWEIRTGYCMKKFNFGKVVQSVAWCPNNALSLVAVAVENRIVLINAGVGDKVVVQQTEELLKDAPDNSGYIPPERVRTAVTWMTGVEARKVASQPLPEGSREDPPLIPRDALVVLKLFRPAKQVTWHAKGDYFATVCSDGANRAVLIHQLSKWRSQVPFSKAKGLVQCVLFHPVKPYLFVATQRHVRIYNLTKLELTKKLMTGAKWISSMAIHSHGDNVLVGTYDKRVQWFDLDLSTSPYQVLRYHTNAVRSVAYHPRYPLFASCGDDVNIVVSHGMVYNDLLTNPLIVPVKQLRGHTRYDDFGVMNVTWHPTQPWLLSGGSDGYIKLWT